MALKIHSRCAGDGPAVILLHGLFGAGSNLGALARSLSDAYTVYSLDLPGHGRSGWLERYSLRALAQSVVDWMAEQGVHSAHFVGHSLGGKVAMQTALSFPERVQRLVVADIAPVAYTGRHGAVFNGLAAVAEAACTRRDEAQALLQAHITEADVIQFLLGSLKRDETGTYRWRLDVDGLHRDYAALLAAPAETRSWPGPVLFIKGEESDYLLPEHRPAIEQLFPAADLRVMQGSGHWLHAEKPELFNGIVARFLPEPGAADVAHGS